MAVIAQRQALTKLRLLWDQLGQRLYIFPLCKLPHGRVPIGIVVVVVYIAVVVESGSFHGSDSEWRQKRARPRISAIKWDVFIPVRQCNAFEWAYETSSSDDCAWGGVSRVSSGNGYRSDTHSSFRCNTCRARKVKCDAVRPICSRELQGVDQN